MCLKSWGIIKDEEIEALIKVDKDINKANFNYELV